MQATVSPNGLPRITARKLLGVSLDNIWDSLFGDFVLIFDDGQELVTNHKETIFSRYAWEFHNRYQGTPLLARHHVSTILEGGRVTMSTHLDLLNNVLWDTVDHITPNYSPTQMSYMRYELGELSYEITNRIYNDLTVRTEEYVGTLNLLDFHSIFRHPELEAAYESRFPDDEWVSDIYATIERILRHKSMHDNPLSKVYRSSLVSSRQLLQCLGPRGYVTDIDQVRFAFPVTRGYYQGIRSYYQYSVETSSTARSLYSAKGPLQDTEYFSRKLQLMCMSVENLHYGDCGTTKYMHWHVKGKSESGPSDLNVLEGKYYVADDGTLKAVTLKDRHLEGKTIKLRAVKYCRIPDPVGVCSTCFGMMSEQIPPNSNLGHICCTHIAEKSAQGVLSTKHLDVSARIDAVMVDQMWQRFVRVGTDGNSYLFADNIKMAMKQGRVRLRLNNEGALTLRDIYITDNIGTIPESRFTEFQSIILEVDTEQFEIPVNHEKRMAYLTWDFLEYIKQLPQPFEEDELLGQYIIDLSGWKNTKPFMSLPMKHFSMSDHSKDIAQVLESSVKEVAERDRLIDPSTTLIELAALVNKKIKVNLAPLEITLYGAMIRSASGFDYALPKPHTEAGLGVMKYTILYRSLAAYMAFEHHAVAVYSPESYVLTNRPESLMDAILMTREVEQGGYRANEQNVYTPGKMARMTKPTYWV